MPEPAAARRLMSSVSPSLLRYEAPTWCTALEIERNNILLNRTFRFSEEAFRVIARMIPVGIVLAEDSECYKKKVVNGQATIAVRTSRTKLSKRMDSPASSRSIQTDGKEAQIHMTTNFVIPVQVRVDPTLGSGGQMTGC